MTLKWYAVKDKKYGKYWSSDDGQWFATPIPACMHRSPMRAASEAPEGADFEVVTFDVTEDP